ncbi:MAG: hypothetical protein ACJ71Y_09060, partial [Blastococcus sp.]
TLLDQSPGGAAAVRGVPPSAEQHPLDESPYARLVGRLGGEQDPEGDMGNRPAGAGVVRRQGARGSCDQLPQSATVMAPPGAFSSPSASRVRTASWA